MARLSEAVTTKFSPVEKDRLKALADAAGVPLRTFIRRRVLESPEVSRETSLLLAEVRRTRELLVRLWSASADGHMDGHGARVIAAQVEAIDGCVLTARALGKEAA